MTLDGDETPDAMNDRGILESLGQNLRVTADLSTRVTMSPGGEASFQNAVGLDLHKVVSTDAGDWGTVDAA